MAMLTVFGELAFPRLDVEHIIGSEKMKESKMLRRIRKEGQVIEKRTDLLTVIRGRFGDAVAAQLADTINTLEDLDSLTQLFNALVLRGISAEEFQAQLAATGNEE